MKNLVKNQKNNLVEIVKKVFAIVLFFMICGGSFLASENNAVTLTDVLDGKKFEVMERLLTIDENETAVENSVKNEDEIEQEIAGKEEEPISVIMSMEGSGTDADPYIVMTADDLNDIRNNLSASYKLGANIDLTGIDWEPIGTRSGFFNGLFDGDGYTINNLTVNKPNNDDVGLFGYAYWGRFRNVIIKNANVTGNNNVGTLAGYHNYGELNSCFVTGTVTGNYVSGITSGTCVGGLVGSRNGTIKKCGSEVTVTGSEHVGGLVGAGYGSNCYIYESYSNSNVSGINYVGGLAGSSVLRIESGYSKGTVTGTSCVGGLVGQINGSWTNGNVTGYYYECYSTCNLPNGGDALVHLGGYAGVSPRNCYWSSELSGVQTAGFTNKNCFDITANDFKNKETFSGYDFSGIWTMTDDNLVLAGIERIKEIKNIYTITNAQELNNIRVKYYLNYELANDINLSGINNWEPIYGFTGCLDGNNHKITGLKIDYQNTRTGLVGYNKGTIQNLIVENADVKGVDEVGILVGNNESGVIKNCFTSGDVSGNNRIGGLAGHTYAGTIERCGADVNVICTNYYAGGLIGSTYSLNIINNVFTLGSVQGKDSVAGIVGYICSSNDSISNSYTISNISGTTNVGAIVGYHNGETIQNSYFNSELTGIQNDTYATQKSIQELVHQSSFSNWDFTNAWSINEGTTLPYLNSSFIPNGINKNNIQYTTYMGGSGTKTDPYVITNVEELYNVRKNLNAHYILGNNIDCSGFEDWLPIGDYTYRFTGTLNGQGYTISNLNMVESKEYFGIFGCVSGTIKNVKLLNINITTENNALYNYVGTLAGRVIENEEISISNIEVNNCTVNGNVYVGGLVGASTGAIENVTINNVEVTGAYYIGGLVGFEDYAGEIAIQNVELLSGSVVSTYSGEVGGLVGRKQGDSKITNCKANINVTGKGDNVGGLIGGVSVGAVENCYATGDVVGENSCVGGLIGMTSSNSPIRMCYSTGSVTANNAYVGGLLGGTSSIVENCFSTSSVTGKSSVGGLVGIANEQIINSYAIGAVTQTVTGNYVGGLKGDGYTNYTVTNSYWTPETTLQASSWGDINKKGEPNNIDNMSRVTGYTDWDFTDVWTIEPGTTIAYLKNVDKPDSVIISNVQNIVSFDSGDGTEQNPYIIKTPEQLQAINGKLNAYYELGADIDLTGRTWEPIGNNDLIFTGKLDGKDYTISNLTLEKDRDYIGLFGYITGEITNVKLSNFSVTIPSKSSRSYVGSLVGCVAQDENAKISNIEVDRCTTFGIHYIGGLIGSSKGVIENVKMSNVDVTGTGQYVGGLVGSENYAGEVAIQNVEINSGKVISNGNNVGGLAGEKHGTGKIINCKVKINVSGYSSIGGLVGYADNGNIEKCYSAGNVTATGTNIGGLVGVQYGGAPISECYSTGSVNSTSQYVGGLVGYQGGEISNSFSTASVTGSYYVGGLIGVGYSNLINSYAIGKVTITGNSSHVGGLRGDYSSYSNVTNSYWTPETTTQVDSCGDVGNKGKPNNIDSMSRVAGYTDWNFTDIWTIEPGTTIAYLKNVDKPDSVIIVNMQDAVSFDGGNGTEQNPYIIKTPEQLQAINGRLDAYYKLGANIDLTGKTWEPIGNDGIIFTGKLDGQGYTIKNLTLEKDRNYLGLFGYITGEIANVKLSNFSVTIPNNSNKSYVGSLVGFVAEDENAKISNIEVDGCTTFGIHYIGGLIGSSKGVIENVKMSNVDVTGTGQYVGGLVGSENYAGEVAIQNVEINSGKVISNGNNVGGLAGEKYGAGKIINCKVKINVSGYSSIGGLVGYADNGNIEKCYSAGNVTATGTNIGGLVGVQNGGAPISECYSTGNVTSTGSYVGGLVGYQGGQVINSFSTASVTGDGYVGGLIGIGVSNLTNSYAIGKVTKTGNGSYAGGLRGDSYWYPNVTNSYWTPETTIQTDSHGELGNKGEPNNIDNMSRITGYTDWDFTDVWTIENGTIAYLKNVDKPDSVIIANMQGVVSFDSGDGTEQNPYVIKTPEQLQAMNGKLDAYYELGANIDLTGRTWEPIGNSALIFTGKLDGNNYTISNLTLQKDRDYIGLFGYVTGEITNVKLSNFSVTIPNNSNKSYVGSLVGCVAQDENAKISNIEVDGCTTLGTNYVGGLIGYSYGVIENVKMSNIDVTGKVNYVGGLVGLENNSSEIAIQNVEMNGGRVISTGGSYVGGLLGHKTGTGKIVNCKSTLNFSGYDQIGGLIGYLENGILEKSYASANITGRTSVGGLIGSDSSPISECYAAGSVTSTGQHIGGLVGTQYGEIENCFSTSFVKGNSTVGGLVGYSQGNITNSYALGKTVRTGTGSIGGLRGDGYVYSNVTNSYWCPETTLQLDSYGQDGNKGTSQLLEELSHEANYSGWDFTDVWAIDEGETTAYLQALDKPVAIKADGSDITVPETAIITEKPDTKTSNSLTFDVQAEDADSGVYTIDVYVDYELKGTLKYDIPKQGLVEDEITIDGLIPNHDYRCYIVVTDMAGFTTRSDSIIVRTNELSMPTIYASTTDYTKENVTITINANLTNSQSIEYRTDYYNGSFQSFITNLIVSPNTNWTTYTGPFDVKENMVIYARVTDGVRYTQQVHLVVDNIDKEAPDVTGEYFGNGLKLKFKDNGVSGVDKFQYVVTDRVLTTAETPNFGNEISLNGQTEYNINLNAGENFVYVQTTDVVGNTSIKKLGGYYIPEGNISLEIECVSNMSEDIKNEGVELNIDGKTGTSGADGKVTFELAKKIQGEYIYVLEESVAPDGYKSIQDAEIRIAFDYYGNVSSVKTWSPNINVVKGDGDEIKLKLVSIKEDVAEYSVIVKTVDAKYNSIEIKDVNFDYAFTAESGETSNLKNVSDVNGEANFGFINGNGELHISITETKAAPGYYLDNTPLKVCLDRDIETGVVTLTQGKNSADLKISISKSDKKIIILRECEAKDLVNEFTLKFSTVNFGKTSKIEGVQFTLEQPYGFGDITKTTDSEGKITFDNLVEFGEGSYIYKIKPQQNNDFDLNEIQLVVNYDKFKKVTSVREITSDIKVIDNKQTEKTDVVTNNFILELEKDLSSANELEAMNLVVRAVDDNDSSKFLKGLEYRVTTVFKGVNSYNNEITDNFGECSFKVVKEDDMYIRIKEVSSIKGYKLNDTEKTIKIVRDSTTGAYQIDNNNTSQDIVVTVDEATNTIVAEIKCKTKVSALVKGNIAINLWKLDNSFDRTILSGVEFKITETTTGAEYNNLTTNKYGYVGISGFEVKDIGRYEFLIEEIQPVYGFELFEGPIKLEVEYMLDQYENVMKVATINVLENEKYVIAKSYKEEEGTDIFDLSIDLTLTNMARVEDPVTNPKTSFNILKNDGQTSAALADTKFNIMLLFENGTYLSYDGFTNKDGNLLREYLLPQGRTIIKIQELESAPGYELDSTVYEIVVNREDDNLQLVESDTVIDNIDINQVDIVLVNNTYGDKDKLIIDDLSKDEFNNLPSGVPGQSNNPNNNPNPDYPDNPDNPTPIPTPVDPDNPVNPVNPQENITPFTIEVVNVNKYNPNIQLTGSTINVSIEKDLNCVYNNSRKLWDNYEIFHGIALDGKMKIKVQQTEAPFHHVINDYVYQLDIERDYKLNRFYVENHSQNDTISYEIDELNNKIVITIINEPSDFMLGITTVDSEDTSMYVGGAGFKVNTYFDMSGQDLRTNTYMQTDDNGIAAESVNVYETNQTTLYTIANVKNADLYKQQGTSGINITFDENGFITNAVVLNGGAFTQNVCTITKIENKYVEVKILLEKEPEPTYSFKVINKNSENENDGVWGAEYRVRVLQERGSKINKVIGTSWDGTASLNKISGTGEIKLEVTQTKCAEGFKFDSTKYTIVVNRSVLEVGSVQKGVITLDSTKSSNANIEIDNLTNEIILNLTSEPVFEIFVEKVDYERPGVKLFDVEFTLTSDLGDSLTGTTDINGRVHFPLGKAIISDTVKYTLTETSTLDGYEITEPVEITAEFDDTGKITTAAVTQNNAMAEITGTPRTSISLRVYNKMISVDDINDPNNPNNPNAQNSNSDSDLSLNLFKINAQNNGIKIDKVVFDVLVTAETGEKKHAIETSDTAGRITVDKIKGSGMIRIDITEIETPFGYAIDNKTRTITVRKYSDDNGIIYLDLIEDETTDDFEVNIYNFDIMASIDNDLLSNAFNITIEKHDKDENSLLVKGAFFDIKDVALNKTETIETDKHGLANIVLPSKDVAGLYVYRIVEQDNLTGYKPAEGIAELQVTFNDSGEIVSAQLYGVDESQYKISYTGERYIKIEAVDERREMNLDDYDLIVAKVDRNKNNEPIPNSLLDVTVGHQYGIAVSKQEYTNNLGEVYLNKLNGHGEINVDIQELMGQNLYANNVRRAKFLRDEITGLIELVDSTNVDIEIDNDNRVVKITLKNLEDTLPAGFMVEKKDADDELVRIPNIEFEIMNETEQKGNEYITDEEGRFNVPYTDAGSGVEFTIREIRTELTGYNAIPDLRVKATFNGTVTTLDILEGAEYASVVPGTEKVYPKLVIKNTQKELDVGSYRLEIVKSDVNEHDIALEGAKFRTKITNQLGVGKLIKEEETNANGRIYFNKINGAGDIEISVQELKAPTDYSTDYTIRKVFVNRDATTGEMTLTNKEGLEDADVVINNANKTISIYIPDTLKDGKYNMVVQKVDNDGNLIEQSGVKFVIVESDLIVSSTTDGGEAPIDAANIHETNIHGKAILPLKQVPEREGIIKYTIKELVAPNGYVIDENEYEIGLQFQKVNGVMKIVNVIDDKNLPVQVAEYNDKFVRINFMNGMKSEEPLYLRSSIYTIDDVYCDRVSPDTTIKSFVEKLQTNGTLRVISKDGTDLSLTDDVTLVGTTFTVRAEKGNKSIEKTVVVVGDYNGDGTITIADVGAVNKYFLGAIPTSEIRDRICDITGDNVITISDVGKLNKFFLGAIPRLINYPGQ